MLPLLPAPVGEGGASFCGRLEANLLPVFLSLTAPGLNPNGPLIDGGGGFAACLGCSGGLAGPPVEAGVNFLTPPIGGGGGGGGGGAPPVYFSKEHCTHLNIC